jgi:protein SCO1/2
MTTMKSVATIMALLLAGAITASGQAKFTEKPDYSATVREMPEAMKRAGFEQRYNSPLPLDTILTDEHGASITLGSLFNDKPILLNFVYFNCPMLCNVILNSLADTLKQIPFEPGKDYTIVTVSFDHTEGYELAAAKKQAYVDYLGKPGGADGWRFLTGSEEAVKALTEASGFTFAWDEERKEYAHASGIMLATPEGILSHYFFGVVFEPRDVRLGLVDASAGRIGTALDKATLFFCYMYDPNVGTYSWAIFRILRIGGLLTILLVGGFIIRSIRQEKRHPHPLAQPA